MDVRDLVDVIIAIDFVARHAKTAWTSLVRLIATIVRDIQKFRRRK